MQYNILGRMIILDMLFIMSRCNTLITKISAIEDPVLLQHFFAHYRKLGIERFLILLHSPGRNKDIEKQTKQLEKFGATVLSVIRGSFCEQTIISYLNMLKQERLAPREWCMHVDADEFLAIHPKLLKRITESNADYVCGKFVDRIARDWSLQPIQPKPALQKQFPRKISLTSCIGGETTKIPLARREVLLRGGAHGLLDSKTTYQAYTNVVIKVLHFKWTASLPQKLENRLNVQVINQPHWCAEMRRTQFLIENNTIDAIALRYLMCPTGIFRRRPKTHATLRRITCVSFPRSGHHFLMNCLARYFGQSLDFDTRSYETGQQKGYVVAKSFVYWEPYQQPQLSPEKEALVRCRKTHDFNDEETLQPNGFYITQSRELLPTIVSYYRMRVQCEGKQDSMEEWNTFSKYVFKQWKHFQQKWVTSNCSNKQCLHVEYSTLVSKPLDELQRVIHFFAPEHEIDMHWLRAVICSMSWFPPRSMDETPYPLPVDIAYELAYLNQPIHSHSISNRK